MGMIQNTVLSPVLSTNATGPRVQDVNFVVNVHNGGSRGSLECDHIYCCLQGRKGDKWCPILRSSF